MKNISYIYNAKIFTFPLEVSTSGAFFCTQILNLHTPRHGCVRAPGAGFNQLAAGFFYSGAGPRYLVYHCDYSTSIAL